MYPWWCTSSVNYIDYFKTLDISFCAPYYLLSSILNLKRTIWRRDFEGISFFSFFIRDQKLFDRTLMHDNQKTYTSGWKQLMRHVKKSILTTLYSNYLLNPSYPPTTTQTPKLIFISMPEYISSHCISLFLLRNIT